MNVTLTKLSNNQNALRTKEVTGVALAAPEVGKPFTLYAQSLTDPDAVRYVSTSPVTRIEPLASGYQTLVATENSLYLVETEQG